MGNVFVHRIRGDIRRNLHVLRGKRQSGFWEERSAARYRKGLKWKVRVECGRTMEEM